MFNPFAKVIEEFSGNWYAFTLLWLIFLLALSICHRKFGEVNHKLDKFEENIDNVKIEDIEKSGNS